MDKLSSPRPDTTKDTSNATRQIAQLVFVRPGARPIMTEAPAAPALDMVRILSPVGAAGTEAARERRNARKREQYAANPERRRERNRKYAAANREKVREGARKFYAANREKVREGARKFRVANREKVRAYKRKASGLPIPTYPETSNCECCGRFFDCSTGWPHLDHCHVTGKFRGWLCKQCNLGIGKLGDNIEGVTRAINYLRKSQ